jgi:hypothetical protein
MLSLHCLAMSAKASPSKHSFSATIVRLGVLYCVHVPLAVSRALGERGNVSVLVRVDGGLPFHGTLVPRGSGYHRLIVNHRVRKGAGAGYRLSIELTVEPRTREVPIPDDLDFALRDAGVLAAWEALPPGKREHIVGWIEEAVHEATREKRIAMGVQEALARHEKILDRQRSV